MTTIKLTPELDSQITYWKVSGDGFEKLYNRKNCKSAETALNRVLKNYSGKLIVSGLTMHAETKPVLIH